MDRRGRIIKANGLLVVVAIAVGGVTGWMFKFSRWPNDTMIAVAVVLFAAGIAATIPYWRSIDDAAREAHKTAWYWGGGFGTGAGLLSAMAVGGGALSPMARGALLTAGLQVGVYFVVWAAWWLARRPAAT